MGWNKQSSGTKCDSTSGHGFVLGSQTKKILQFKVMSKSCSRCSLAAARKVEVKPQACPKNYEGSSKSMETEAIFRMVIEAHDELGFCIKTIILDDDSTTKANLKHRLHIPEPKFLADFNHRVKVVGKSIYNLAKMPQKDSKVTKAMAERIKTKWGSMLRQIRHVPKKILQ